MNRRRRVVRSNVQRHHWPSSLSQRWRYAMLAMVGLTSLLGTLLLHNILPSLPSSSNHHGVFWEQHQRRQLHRQQRQRQRRGPQRHFPHRPQHHEDFRDFHAVPPAHQRPDHDDDPTKVQANTHQQQPSSILIVGGSDGSGTRGIVQALGQLGVPMLVDDTQTLDVHALPAHGWPPLVQSVLQTSSRVTDTTATAVVWPPQLLQAWQRVDRVFSRRVRHLLDHDLVGRPTATHVAYGFKAPVSMLLLPFLADFYASGASSSSPSTPPTSSTTIRFLHVVRDGRDIAMSSNQSPVHKFYDLYYGPSVAAQRRAAVQNQTAVLAMDVWNDWNVHVANEVCRTTKRSSGDGATTSNGGRITCLLVRAEDLLHDKYTTLQRMAAFVGSPRNAQELCCLAHREEKDLGASVAFNNDEKQQHHGRRRRGRKSPPRNRRRRRLQEHQPPHDGPLHRHSSSLLDDELRPPSRTDDTTLEVPLRIRKKRPRNRRFGRGGFHEHAGDAAAANTTTHVQPLGSRFGKWKTALKDQPDLLRLLEEHGQRGLELFGYKPLLVENSSAVHDSTPTFPQCTAQMRAQCS